MKNTAKFDRLMDLEDSIRNANRVRIFGATADEDTTTEQYWELLAEMNETVEALTESERAAYASYRWAVISGA